MAYEEWRNFPVIGKRSYSKYEVSSLGRTRNKKSMVVFSDKPNDEGYVKNKFYDDEGNRKMIATHVIVTRAFLDEPESDNLTPDHINRERADNRVVNLRWATREQQAGNSDNSKCKTKGQPVVQYTMDMEEIKTWPTITTAEKELGIAGTGISKACKGKQKTSGGFKWAYERREDLDGEIWKEYKLFDAQVSNMGRIKPPRYHIVYGSKNGSGYMTYGKPSKRVHVMVAEVFLPNPEKKPQVTNKD